MNVKHHESLNYVKGAMYAPCLIDVPENEKAADL